MCQRHLGEGDAVLQLEAGGSEFLLLEFYTQDIVAGGEACGGVVGGELMDFGQLAVGGIERADIGFEGYYLPVETGYLKGDTSRSDICSWSWRISS